MKNRINMVFTGKPVSPTGQSTAISPNSLMVTVKAYRQFAVRKFLMNNRHEIVDRRKPKRFEGQNSIYITIKDNGCKLGQIININERGCEFLYVASEERITDFVMADFFSCNNDFYLRNLPLKIISDIEQKKNPPLIDGKTRRCCAKFCNLSRAQKILIDHFIKKKFKNDSNP